MKSAISSEDEVTLLYDYHIKIWLLDDNLYPLNVVSDMKPELQREFYFSGFLLSHLHFLGKQQRVKFRVRITEENLK